jgi:hypothetical protein
MSGTTGLRDYGGLGVPEIDSAGVPVSRSPGLHWARSVGLRVLGVQLGVQERAEAWPAGHHGTTGVSCNSSATCAVTRA